MAKKLEMTVINPAETLDNFDLSAEIVAGKLTSNAKELSEKIKQELKNYTVEKYINDPTAAKTDKAFLNKVAATVADKRKSVTKEWQKPLDEFLNEMKNLESEIFIASNNLNTIVKEAQEKEKNEKKKQIEEYYKTIENPVVSLEKIFNSKWLNKTTKIESVMLEIEEKLEKITSELATLRSMNSEDSEILQAFYLETLDLNATLLKGNQLKANKEAAKKVAENAQKSQKTEEKPAGNEENLQKTNEFQQKNAQNQSNLLSYTLRLKGTKEQLIALRKYMAYLKIDYEKV